MNDIEKQYSVAVTIDSHNGYHVHYRLFEKMILVEYRHEDVNRAMSGKAVTGAEEFDHFIQRLRPHLVLYGDGVDASNLPDSLTSLLINLKYEEFKNDFMQGWKLSFEGSIPQIPIKLLGTIDIPHTVTGRIVKADYGKVEGRLAESLDDEQ